MGIWQLVSVFVDQASFYKYIKWKLFIIIIIIFIFLSLSLPFSLISILFSYVHFYLFIWLFIYLCFFSFVVFSFLFPALSVYKFLFRIVSFLFILSNIMKLCNGVVWHSLDIDDMVLWAIVGDGDATFFEAANDQNCQRLMSHMLTESD